MMCSYRYGQQFKSKALIKLLLFILVLSDCYLKTSGSSGKVIGGRRAVLGEFPATVALVGTIRCGGTLISLATVVTAAHCLCSKGKLVNPSSIVIIGGAVYLYDESGNRQESYMKDYLIHDQYKPINTLYGKYRLNDIAAAFLETAFVETKTLKPALFPANNAAGMREYMGRMKQSNATCLGTGFGLVSIKPKYASIYLKVADLSLLPNTVLADLEEYEANAISKNDMGTTSFGDSGSTFLCGGQIVGMTKAGLTTLVDGKNVTTLIFTLLGPYFDEFGLGGCDGKPKFLFLPVFLLCFLNSSFYCSGI